ncbi:hypothetical protein [Persephonella sp.]
MSKNENYPFTPEFKILMNHLGWGDPNPIILTVGIEEGGVWCWEEMEEKNKREFEEQCEKSTDFSNKLEYVKYCIRKRFNEEIVPVKIEKNSKENNNNFPIAHPVAKIACGISKSCKDWKKNWKCYRNKKLWTEGSKIANINLYPLGKKNLKGNFPSCYKELFGLTEENMDLYKECVKKTRFEHIRKFTKEKKVKAIICYGKQSWDDFREVFELPKKEGEKLVRYDDKKVILVRHFSNGFPDELCDEIISILTKWGVSLD